MVTRKKEKEESYFIIRACFYVFVPDVVGFFSNKLDIKSSVLGCFLSLFFILFYFLCKFFS